MAISVRRAIAAPVWAACAFIVAGVLLGGCSEQGSAERLPDDSPLFVQTSPTSIKLENRAGLALTDVAIVVEPFGPLEFSMRVSRLEPSEKRDIPLNQLRARDGTPFNARFHKPRNVRVNLKDTAGKTYEIEIPWS